MREIFCVSFLIQFLHSSDIKGMCVNYHGSKFVALKRKTLSGNFLFKILFHILHSENCRFCYLLYRL